MNLAKSMAFAVLDEVILVVHGREAPNAEEWAAFLALVMHQGVDGTAHLVISHGGQPTRAQRKQLVRVFDRRAVPIAVVSESLRVRVTVLALSWFGGLSRAFPRLEMMEALDYLRITFDGKRVVLLHTLAMLERELGMRR